MNSKTKYYERRAKYRREQALQIQHDCREEYPDCSRCGFYIELNGRIPTCAFGTRAKDWRLPE